MWLALALTPPLMLVMLGHDPAAARGRGPIRACWLPFAPYLKALIWGILPLLLYTAFRRYLQAVDMVKPVTFALVSANLVNVVGNWVLMYGHWGARAMGLEGSGWSTSIARVYMAAVLLGAIVWHERAYRQPAVRHLLAAAIGRASAG